MQDRVSEHPGRIKLTPVPGQENTFDMVRADEPVQEGTPLNRATLLTDEVAAAIGALTGGDTPETPSEALSLLRGLIANGAKIETGSYTGTGTYGSSNPNSLTFGFKPIVVFVYGGYYFGCTGLQIAPFWHHSLSYGYSLTTNYNHDTVIQTRYWWEDNTLHWYANVGGAGYQLNERVSGGDAGRGTYYYLAIG